MEKQRFGFGGDHEDYERLKVEFNNLSKNGNETARSEDILSAKKTIRRKR